MKYGFVEPKVTLGNYVQGSALSLPKIVVREDGQWDDFLPKAELQRNEYFDTYNCTAYGTQNAYEILIKARYGEELDFSERDLGIKAGTYPPGNDPHTVSEAARKKGLVPDAMLPFDATIKTVDEYFSYPTDKKQRECEAASKINLKNYNLFHEWVFNDVLSINDQRIYMQEALMYSPLGVALYAWEKQGDVYVRKGKDVHWTVIYGYYPNGDWKCFDTYDYSTKRLDKDFGFTWVKRYHVEYVGNLGKVEVSVFKQVVELLRKLGILK